MLPLTSLRGLLQPLGWPPIVESSRLTPRELRELVYWISLAVRQTAVGYLASDYELLYNEIVMYERNGWLSRVELDNLADSVLPAGHRGRIKLALMAHARPCSMELRVTPSMRSLMLSRWLLRHTMACDE